MQVRTFSATGADDDIVVSSVRAYVSAMNKLIAFIARSQQRASRVETGAGTSQGGEVSNQTPERDLTLA